MKYGLYEDSKNSSIVEMAISCAIDEFIQTLKALNKNYRGTGVTDTSAREHIAEAISDAIMEGL